MPTPPNFRELAQSIALAARTNKVDSNDRALLKLNGAIFRTLRVLVKKYFLYYPTLQPSSRVVIEELRIGKPRKRWSLPPAF